jgi:hypothetical protein
MAAIDPNAPASTPRPTKALLPTGPYLVSIKWAEKTLSNKGTPRIAFQYEIVAGEHKGKVYREDAYLTSGSLWKVQTLAKAAGVKRAFDPDNGRDLLDAFVGKQLKIVISEDNWTDNTGAEREGRKISVFESLDPEVKRQMDAERQARFGGKGTGPAAGTSARNDDEVPF